MNGFDMEHGHRCAALQTGDFADDGLGDAGGSWPLPYLIPAGPWDGE